MNIKLLLKLGLVITVIFVSLLLRKKDFAQIPIPGQSVDEYSNSWVGLSLIKLGIPVGVSGIEGYKNKIIKYVNVDNFFQTVSTGDPLVLNYPWMDHPPLLGLITGGFAYFSGARVFEETTSLIIRKPIIIISTLTVLLIIIFCWINYNFWTAILAGLLYGTTPLIVLSGRMIQSENAIIPCFILSLIFISLYIKKKKDYWLILTALVAGVATLFKLTGLVCHITIFFVLLKYYRKNFDRLLKDYGYFLLISLPISFLFVVYGFVYDGENFKNILFSNYDRFYGIGPNSIIELIRNQRLTQHKFLPETALICGWIIFLGKIVRKSNPVYKSIPSIAIISYLIVYIFFGSQPYGWYTFVFWPFLIILLARYLSKGIESNKNKIGIFIIAVTILGANISRILGIFEFQKYSNWWRIGLSAMLFILLFNKITLNKNYLFSKILLIILIILIVITNIYYINAINIDYWWQNIS